MARCIPVPLPPKRSECVLAVYKAQEANTNPADPLMYRATKYFICGLLGLCIAGTAFGVNIGVENIAGFKFWLTFQAYGYVAPGRLVHATAVCVCVCVCVCTL